MKIRLYPENDRILLTKVDYKICCASDEEIIREPCIYINNLNSYHYSPIKLDKLDYINEILTDIPEKQFDHQTRGEIYHGSIRCIYTTKEDNPCAVCDSTAEDGADIILLGNNSPWIHRDCCDEFLEIINRVEDHQDKIAADML